MHLEPRVTASVTKDDWRQRSELPVIGWIRGYKAGRGNRVLRQAFRFPLWSEWDMPDQIAVLVAEDEEMVRLVTAEALRDEGLEVMEAEHAEAALSVLAHHALRIHVLFTDIQMPGSMDGLALAHHTSKNWPRIALLITSAHPHPDRARFPEKSRFLAKPYSHSRVVQHIRELAAPT